MPDGKAAEVAGWLARVIEQMLADGEIGPGRLGLEHARDLVRKLRAEARLTAPGTQGAGNLLDPEQEFRELGTTNSAPRPLAARSQFSAAGGP